MVEFGGAGDGVRVSKMNLGWRDILTRQNHRTMTTGRWPDRDHHPFLHHRRSALSSGRSLSFSCSSLSP
ncbi:hypothetical protein HanIR_Chr16g0841761 [Helianthus annuus]|nr:hypothetical protein HanIR_Chr16g0841761 [Helianthus annuus]